MNCPHCNKPMTSDPCQECGFLVDPRGDDIEIAKVLNAAHGGSGDFVELGTLSANAVLGEPGAGMGFLANDIMQSFSESHPDAVLGTSIDKGESFRRGEVLFGSTRDGMSKPRN